MIIGKSQPAPRTLDELLGADLAARLDGIDVVSRKLFSGSMPGERRSKKRGQSVEFDDFRPYVAGDDLRHIDWNVFARLDRFFVKLFREEQDLSVQIIVDHSPSMLASSPAGEEPGPSKRAFAQKLAMCLGYIAAARNNRVQIASFGTGLRRSSPGRGRAHASHLASFLLDQPEAPADDMVPASFAEDMRRIASARSGKGVAVVISDFLFRADGERAGYERGLGLLASVDFDVCALRVLTPGEIDPKLEGDRMTGDLRLTDAETGATAEITVSRELIQRYKERVASFGADFDRFCRARGISSSLVRTDSSIERLLMRDLRRMGVLR